MTARKAPLPEVDDDACDADVDALSLRDVAALRACVTAADALAAWVADGHDETAIALAESYAAARKKVAT